MRIKVEIVGSQKVNASQRQVFQALLDPKVLKESVPGCSEAEAPSTKITSERAVIQD